MVNMNACMYACMYVCTHTFETLLSSASEVIDSMPDCTEVGLDIIRYEIETMVCMYAHVCMYIQYICTYGWLSIYVLMYIYVCVSVRISERECLQYVCMYVCMYVCKHAYLLLKDKRNNFAVRTG